MSFGEPVAHCFEERVLSKKKEADIMRNKLSMVAALGLALSLPAVSFGGQQSAEGAGNPSKASHKTNHKVAKGEVSAVDLSAKTLTLMEGQKSLTFNFDDKTLIKQAHQTVQPSAITSGMQATVKYTEKDGKDWATSVVLYPAHHKVSTSSANK
jgi:hypothetical protein